MYRPFRLLPAVLLAAALLFSPSLPSFADGATLAAGEEGAALPEEYEITLMAVGDNLMHMGVVYAGKQEDGSLDYSFL